MIAKFDGSNNLNLAHSNLALLSICKQHSNITKLPRTLHRHDDRLELVFVSKGSGTYIIDGINYTTTDGDILIYNAGVLHDEHHMIASPHGESEIFGCSIIGVNILGLPTNHLIKPHVCPKVHSGPHHQSIDALFSLLLSYSKQGKQFNKLLVRHLLSSLLILIVDVAKQYDKPCEDKKLQKIGEQIKAHLDEYYWDEVVLSQLAAQLNISPFYLSHTFKKYSGYTPLQYLTRRRIGEAQTLLLHSKHNLTQISQAVGFNNVTYFQHVFFKYVGITPRDYRNVLLDAKPNTYISADP